LISTTGNLNLKTRGKFPYISTKTEPKPSYYIPAMYNSVKSYVIINFCYLNIAVWTFTSQGNLSANCNRRLSALSVWRI